MRRTRLTIVSAAAVVFLVVGFGLVLGLRSRSGRGSDLEPAALSTATATATATATTAPSPSSPAPSSPSPVASTSTSPPASASASASAPPPASATAPPRTAGSAGTDRATRVKQLNTALAELAEDEPPFSVAVLDKRTGQRYEYRGTVKYDTASIVKAQILACMLLHDQDAGHGPTSGEMALARPMIRLSDNNAASSLFQRVGARTGLTRCNKRLGLTQTVVSSAWGRTRTTADDQVRLLSELVDKSGPLGADSRRTAFTLMSTVSSAQRWGVPSIARSGETAAVKNGWDTRSADGGRWVINTIGRITDDDEANVSVAVLSHDNRTMGAGVALVQKVAKLTRRYLKY